MMEYVKVKDNDGLIRDINTRAIINNNDSDYKRYLNQRNQAFANKLEIIRQAEEITHLKNELSEIKQMLISLTNNNNKET